MDNVNNPNSTFEITVGQKFGSLQELENYVEQYSNEFKVQLFKRDCLTLESAKKTKPKRVEKAKPELKYYRVTFACYKGGRNFQDQGRHIRKSRTFKDGCQMKIRLALSENGQYLEVCEFITEHNHPLLEEVFRHLPRQRRLDENNKKKAIEMLNLRCNNKLVQQLLREKTGKCVTLKDLRNLKQSTLSITKNDLECVVRKLSGPGATVELVVNQDSELLGIFYQDSNMKYYYNKYPEVILCDATYKLNNLRMPLYLIVVIDGNGHCEVVATFLLANETADIIKKMIQIFKNNNDCWNKTVSILTDKDFTERNVLSEEFTNANLFLCLFHTLKTFRTTITAENMNITALQRDTCLQILESITYSKNELQYLENYNKLLHLNFPKVTKYFNENWHPIKQEWVQGLTKQFITFGTSTTNHLENVNQKIKQVCLRYSTLNQFYEDLLCTFAALRLEKDHEAYMTFSKREGRVYKAGSTEDEYFRFLTPYAFNFVEKQLNKITEVNLPHIDNQVIVTPETCSCTFYKNMLLPCKHIFVTRKLNNLPLFSKTLVPERFQRDFYCKLDGHTSDLNEGISQISVSNINEKRRILAQHEKFREANKICTRIATILSEQGMREFSRSIQKLTRLEKLLNDKQNWIIEGDDIDGSNITQENNIADHDYIRTSHIFEPNLIDNQVECKEEENLDQENYISLCDEQEQIAETFQNDEENIVIEEICDMEIDGSIILEPVDNNIIECSEGKNIEQINTVNVHNNQEQLEVRNLAQMECANLITDCDTSNEAIEHSSNITNKAVVCVDKNLEIANIKLPLKMKPRGRPKGRNLTAIGIKKRRKILFYSNQSLFNRCKTMLSSVIKDEAVLSDILNRKHLISEEFFSKKVAEDINCEILDDQCNINEIEIYFTLNGFNKFKEFLHLSRTVARYFCNICNYVIGDDFLKCELCLKRYHIKCTSCKKVPHKWNCLSCKMQIN